MPRFYVGLDLGQTQDYTALMVAEKLAVPTGKVSRYDGSPITQSFYHVRHLERFKLGTSYPSIVERVNQMLREEVLADSALVVDATGVGRPVVDMLRKAGMHPIAVTITAGDVVNREGSDFKVPKRDLVATMQVLLQTERLKVAEELPEASLLVQELLNFQVKLTTAGNDTYGVWHLGRHEQG